jgi:hypothetical protein
VGITVIKTWCSACGELELTSDDLHLHTFKPAHRTGDRNFYEFVCPSCAQLIQRFADVYAVRALRLGEVPETCIELPGEYFDPKREWTLALSERDLAAFRTALDAGDFLADAS